MVHGKINRKETIPRIVPILRPTTDETRQP
jgi:hypothetical protein